MIGSSLQTGELDSFRMANSLLKDPAYSKIGKSFDEVLETQIKEEVKKAKDKASEIVEDKSAKKKKTKDNFTNDELINITRLVQNVDKRSSHELNNTYQLLEQFKESKKLQEEDLIKGQRHEALYNAANISTQQFFQPVYDQNQRKMSKSHMLELWDKFAPLVSEDITKRSIRLDIPLLNDIQAVVLRMHPDKSITASLLGSQAMGELIKQNKDKLDKNLKHHQLSLREFNTYRTELEFNSESESRKQKRKAKQAKKFEVDLI